MRIASIAQAGTQRAHPEHQDISTFGVSPGSNVIIARKLQTNFASQGSQA